MRWIYHDGGRAAAGFKGDTGDCVTRAIAVATGRGYREVYDALFQAERENQARLAKARGAKPASASPRNGIYRDVYEEYLLTECGWCWTPTMQIGQGCRVHLREDELPDGPLVVAVSKHLCAVIDGVVYDTHDPTREGTRCVYGYYLPELHV